MFPMRLVKACVLVGCSLLAFFDLGCSSSLPATEAPVTTSTAKPEAICVEVTPNVLQFSYDPVRISWAVESPRTGDKIEISLKDTPSFVMFRVVLDHINNTDNEYEIRPVNPRGGGYIVKYVKSDGSELCSTHLAFAQGDDEPNQAHITVVGEDQLQVNWVSASSQPGEVLYQTVDGTNWISHKETTNPRTYKGSDMCGIPAKDTGFRHPGYFHSVTFPNIPPFSTVKIRTGNATSKTYTPSPRLPAGDPTGHTVFLVGDLGTTGAGMGGGAEGFGTLEFPPPAAGHVMSRHNDRKISLGIIYGDISYAGGFTTVWDQYGDEFSNNGGMNHPTVMSVGNHEPMYFPCPKGGLEDQVADMLKSDVAPLLEKHHVDLYVSGHIHRYGRFLDYDCHYKTAFPFEKEVLMKGYLELQVVNRSELRGVFWGYNDSVNQFTLIDSFLLAK
ncbi:hypothetical protein FOL47_005459 [Perkinsus chesapeaki]|uniref:Purple acid phosphatase N-terminal domain-containing protein n=1 Tax=Perkinsus chesapeaki TaxID=330153 RepID=A0A7J6LXI8_PERCH|nr:hypothetical protein FOL47_005459 [Perkinsus chesapeaki]